MPSSKLKNRKRKRVAQPGIGEFLFAKAVFHVVSNILKKSDAGKDPNPKSVFTEDISYEDVTEQKQIGK